MTAEQDQRAHLVTHRPATSATNRRETRHKAAKAKGDEDRAVDATGVCCFTDASSALQQKANRECAIGVLNLF